MIATDASARPMAPIADWVLPSRDDTRIRLTRVLNEAASNETRRTRPLRTLGTVARRVVADEVEAKLRAVLGDSLMDVVVGGWHAYRPVSRSVQDSRHRPGIEFVVPLSNHTVAVDQLHDVDVEVDGVPALTLSVELIVDVQLYDAVAVVRDGRITAIRSGQAAASATVTVDGVQIGQRSLTFPLRMELDFGRRVDWNGRLAGVSR